MKKLILILLISITYGLGSEKQMDGKIDFYTKDNLMWLIDETPKNGKYKMKTIKEYKDTGYERLSKVSYQTYINYVNNTKSYKYTDWRLPTVEELKTLEYKGSIFQKMKASFFSTLWIKNEEVADERWIDKDIFTDYKDGWYWTSEKDGFNEKKQQLYKAIYFGNQRYDYYEKGKAASINLRYKGKLEIDSVRYISPQNLRLVRNIK